MSNENYINYRNVGDYLIPNLVLPPEETSITLGKWGMLHKSYLEKHKKALFNSLLMQGKLYQHCAETEKQAQNMFDALVEQMKEENQLEWVQIMSNIQQRANELVCSELIYN